MSKGSAIVGFLLCFVGGMLLMYGIDRSGGGHDSPDAAVAKDGTVTKGANPADAEAQVPVLADDPVWGSSSAPVTMVIYSDYQCPYCSRVEPTIEQMKKKYGPDKLRLVWKDNPLPFHKNAMPAHIAGMTVYKLAGDDAFWKFHDLAFKNNKALTPANFEAWATQAGVDVAKFKAAFADNLGKKKVDATLASAKKVGVRGTPSFFINGIFVSGARPLADFTKHVDQQLAEAKKLAASGTPKNLIYKTLTDTNKAKAPAKPDAKKKPEEDTKTVWKVPVLATDAVKGSPEALVTIVEFSEFQCPFCSRVLPTGKQILDTYKDKVRFVWKDNPLPFHKRAIPAAMLAQEAKAQKGNAGFWAAHDLLFANQKALEDEQLWDYAGQLGLDVGKVKTAVGTNKYAALIETSQEIAMDYQARGTPHFFINGRRLSGAQPFAKFKTIIDEEITKASALVAKGTAKKDIYAELTKNGKTPPAPEKKDVGPAPATSPFKGKANAKVVIQEFSDFQCPYCSRVNGTIKQVMAAFGDDVKIVWRHKPLPFHKDAPLAHEASMEAFVQKGNKGFWAMHDKLFAGQKDPGIKRPALDTYAEQIGLDMTKFNAAMDSRKHQKAITDDAAASTKGGIGGTPGFVVNGYFISGAQPFPQFKKVIKLALKDLK